MSWEGRNWFINGASWWDCYFERCLPFSFRSSLCCTSISGQSLKEKQCFQLKAFLCLPIISPLWWARALYLERCCEGKSLLLSSWLFTASGYGRCSSWLGSCDGFGYVHTVGSSGFAGQEIPWDLIFLLLLTNAQDCNRDSSFLGQVILSGSIIHVAVSVLLLIFVLTGLKLTLDASLQFPCLLGPLWGVYLM